MLRWHRALAASHGKKPWGFVPYIRETVLSLVCTLVVVHPGWEVLDLEYSSILLRQSAASVVAHLPGNFPNLS